MRLGGLRAVQAAVKQCQKSRRGSRWARCAERPEPAGRADRWRWPCSRSRHRIRLNTGKYAARATPIWALAAATRRSAAATSGRRSSSAEGRPGSTAAAPASAASGVGSNVKAGGLLANQNRNRMLDLRAPQADVRRLRPCGLQLGAPARGPTWRPRRRRCRGSRQLQRLRIVGDRVIEQLLACASALRSVK